ncbi:hypothetical protein AB3K25_00685 [Leuconostoc sp. MS02]|uniref:Lactococcin 972 family bacteriocin n=1 Tax=Leuconostoc aquikimchii TaxID=3236804 RepID=A0ABV3S6U8_9LACO
MKKGIILTTMLLGGLAVASSVSAATVTNPNNGHSGSWNYGHDWRIVYTYSETGSTYYYHSASVDSTQSGSQRPGVRAHAEKIGGSGYYWWIS